MPWILGYIQCQVTAGHLERFMNLCRHHEIELWKVCEKENRASFYMYAAQYKQLKSLAKKTKTIPHIKGKYGVPFFYLRAKKDWTFTWGMALFFCVLYLLSMFLWKIEYVGQQTYTKEGLSAEIEKMGVYRGMARKNLQCEKIEQNLRLLHPDLSWVSAEEKGCVLQIQVKEGNMPKSEENTSVATSLTAPCDGTIAAIVTRKGTPLCKKGDKVKKNQILIQGTYDIVGDDGEVIRKQGVVADGEIQIWCPIKWEEEILIEYVDREWTGKNRDIYTIECNDMGFSLKNPLKWFHNSDNYDIISDICFEERFIPWDLNVKITRRRFLPYKKVKKKYTKEQAYVILKGHLESKLEQLQKEGYEILEYTENMTLEGNRYRMTGQIQTCREKMTKKDVLPEEMRIMSGKEEKDGT